MRYPFFLMLHLLLVPGVVGDHATADWPQLGGPDRTFVIAEATPLNTHWPESGPPILWKKAMGPGFSGIAISDQVAYTAFREGNDDVLVALDANTGEELWRHVDPAAAKDFMVPEYGPGPHSTPLVTATSVILAGSTGNLVAVDRSTGTKRWKIRLWDDLDGTPVERGYAASPLAFGDLIIAPVGGRGRAVVAFREADGEVAWSRHDDAIAYSSPVIFEVDGSKQICLLLAESLVGLEPETGDLLWTTPIDTTRYINVTTPVVGPGPRVAVNTARGCQMFEIEPETESGQPPYRARRLWTTTRIGAQEHNMLRVGQRLVGANESATLTVLDVSTGRPLIRTRSIADSNVMIVGKSLLSLTEDGRLAISVLREDRVEVLAEASVTDGRCWAAPALSEGILYVRGADEIVAIDLRKGE